MDNGLLDQHKRFIFLERNRLPGGPFQAQLCALFKELVRQEDVTSLGVGTTSSVRLGPANIPMDIN
jgi:hypothetical protein